jgi:hypothetical protein
VIEREEDSCEDIGGGETVEIEVWGELTWCTGSAFCETLIGSNGGGDDDTGSRVNGRVRAQVNGDEIVVVIDDDNGIVEVEGAVVVREVSLIEVGGAE